MWPQVLCQFFVDEEIELAYVLFDNGGHEHVICWSRTWFSSRSSSSSSLGLHVYQVDPTRALPRISEGDVWVLVVVAVKL